MIDYKLSNILIEDTDRFRDFPMLYHRSTAPIVFDEDYPEGRLLPNAEYDFSTYFNAFSNKKWKRYAGIENVSIRLEVKGDAMISFCSVAKQNVGLDKRVFEKRRVQSEDWVCLEYEYPATDAELLAFRVVTYGPVSIKNGYYSSKVSESNTRDVHLAIVTTTFKKEDYIAANVDLFKREIRNGRDGMSTRVSMIVVDNGRTLDKASLEGDGVYVFANKNVGGSGGFARGMIEAGRLEGEPVTHVLIMDDDIALSSESIKRTYNLLALATDAWADAFVSGAMFSLGNQQMQIEDVGYANASGRFGPVKRGMNMDSLYDTVHNEDDLLRLRNCYAAFWYCCVPMATVRREGLPLPLFIRYDDAEYGQRCRPRFMTMNGINVWHEDFTDRYSAFYERYCGMRNALVVQATSGVCKNVDFFGKLFLPNFKRELKMLNYASAEMMLDAVEDFLKGPSFLMEERCEEILKEKMAKQEKLVPLDELDIPFIDLEGFDKKPKKRTSFQRAIDAFTWNGQRFVPGSIKKDALVAVKFDPNGYPGARVRMRNKILVVDRFGEKGALREVDKARFTEIRKRYRRVMKDYKQNRFSVENEWSSAAPELTSEGFWKRYLGIG